MQKTIKNIFKAIIPSDQRAKLRKIKKQILNYGFKYKCPICGSKLRKFLPFGFTFPVLTQKNVIGGGYRQNAICPICGSYDRERLLYLYLLLKTEIFQKQKKLLHIAPEISLSSILMRIIQSQHPLKENKLLDNMIMSESMLKTIMKGLKKPDFRSIHLIGGRITTKILVARRIDLD